MDDKMYVDLILKGKFDDGITQEFNQKFSDIDSTLSNTKDGISGIGAAISNINFSSYLNYLKKIRNLINDALSDYNTYIGELNRNFQTMLEIRDEYYNKYALEQGKTYNLELTGEELKRYKEAILGIASVRTQYGASYFSGLYGNTAEEIVKNEEEGMYEIMQNFSDFIKGFSNEQNKEFLDLITYTKQKTGLTTEQIGNILKEADVKDLQSAFNVLGTYISRTKDLTTDQLKEIKETTNNEKNAFDYLKLMNENYKENLKLVDNISKIDLSHDASKVTSAISDVQKKYLIDYFKIDTTKFTGKNREEDITDAIKAEIGKLEIDQYLQLLKNLNIISKDTSDARKFFNDVLGIQISNKEQGGQILSSVLNYLSGGQVYELFPQEEFGEFYKLLASEQQGKTAVESVKFLQSVSELIGGNEKLNSVINWLEDKIDILGTSNVTAKDFARNVLDPLYGSKYLGSTLQGISSSDFNDYIERITGKRLDSKLLIQRLSSDVVSTPDILVNKMQEILDALDEQYRITGTKVRTSDLPYYNQLKTSIAMINQNRDNLNIRNVYLGYGGVATEVNYF